MEVETAGFDFDGGASTFGFSIPPQSCGRRLPAVDPHRRALLPEHRGQKRDREIPQLANAEIHRHRVTLGVHATPSMKTTAGDSVQTGHPAVEK